MLQKLTLALVVICLNVIPSLAADLIWNVGPRWKSGTHVNNGVGLCQIPAISDMSEGHLDGNAAGVCPGLTCGGQPNGASDNSCPSFFHVTFGWSSNQFALYPGWDVWRLMGGSGIPMEFRYKNNARNISSPCTLREVGIDISHYPPNLGYYGFKGNYRMGYFSQFRGMFTARNQREIKTSGCSEKRLWVTTAFAIQHMSGSSIVRTDVIEVVIYNPNNLDFDGNPNNAILWSNGCAQTSSLCQVFLHGNKIGVPTLSSIHQS